jgi:hypothetical protein
VVIPWNISVTALVYDESYGSIHMCMYIYIVYIYSVYIYIYIDSVGIGTYHIKIYNNILCCV